MRSKVILTANPNTGNVFTQNPNKPDWGYLRVEQTVVDMSAAVLAPKTISALKPISKESYNKTKNFFSEGMELSGKIIRKETIDFPSEEVARASGYRIKKAGSSEDAPVCKVGNKPVYQTTEYTESIEETDLLVQHTNTEEIKAYQAVKKTAEALN